MTYHTVVTLSTVDISIDLLISSTLLPTLFNVSPNSRKVFHGRKAFDAIARMKTLGFISSKNHDAAISLISAVALQDAECWGSLRYSEYIEAGGNPADMSMETLITTGLNEIFSVSIRYNA